MVIFVDDDHIYAPTFVSAFGTNQKYCLTQTGTSFRMLALPYGEYEPSLIYQLKALSFYIFGQHSGAVSLSDLPMIIPRFPMGGRYSDLATFGTKISTRAFPDQGKVINPILIHSQSRPLLGS